MDHQGATTTQPPAPGRAAEGEGAPAGAAPPYAAQLLELAVEFGAPGLIRGSRLLSAAWAAEVDLTAHLGSAAGEGRGGCQGGEAGRLSRGAEERHAGGSVSFFFVVLSTYSYRLPPVAPLQYPPARKDAGAAAMLQFVLDSLPSRADRQDPLSAGVVDRLLSGIGSATPEVGRLAAWVSSGRVGFDRAELACT